MMALALALALALARARESVEPGLHGLEQFRGPLVLEAGPEAGGEYADKRQQDEIDHKSTVNSGQYEVGGVGKGLGLRHGLGVHDVELGALEVVVQLAQVVGRGAVVDHLHEQEGQFIVVVHPRSLWRQPHGHRVRIDEDDHEVLLVRLAGQLESGSQLFCQRCGTAWAKGSEDFGQLADVHASERFNALAVEHHQADAVTVQLGQVAGGRLRLGDAARPVDRRSRASGAGAGAILGAGMSA